MLDVHAGSPALPAWCKHIPHVWILSWILVLNTTPSKLFKVDLTSAGYSLFFDHWKSHSDAKGFRSKEQIVLLTFPWKIIQRKPLFKEHLVPPTMDSSVFCLDRRFPHPRPALDLQGYPQVHLMLWHRHLGGRCQKKRKHSFGHAQPALNHTHRRKTQNEPVTRKISRVIRIFNSFHPL